MGGVATLSENMPPTSAPLPIARLVDLLRNDPSLRGSLDAAQWQRFDEIYAQYEVCVNAQTLQCTCAKSRRVRALMCLQSNQLSRKLFVDGLCGLVGKPKVLETVKAAQQMQNESEAAAAQSAAAGSVP